MASGTTEDDLNNLASNLEQNLNVDINLNETINWLPNKGNDTNLTMEQLAEWILVGNQCVSIEKEYNFCSDNIVDKFIILIRKFEKFTITQKTKANARCYPLEKFNKFFLSRDAIKCANLDAILNISNPIDPNNYSLVNPLEPFYMIDLTERVSGFTDYMLWRNGWLIKIFILIRSYIPLNEFATTAETLETYKLHGYYHNTNSILNFQRFIKTQTINGVHLIVCNGIASSAQDQNSLLDGKENASKHYLLTSCIYGLLTLRENGTFILKIFETFTPFTVGLIYLMQKCFRQISLFKPITSRPTNSERYLICQWKYGDTKMIEKHLLNINDAMNNLKKHNQDILQLVPIDILKNDKIFFQYIFNSNISITTKQINAMEFKLKCLNDPLLSFSNKEDYNLKCLQLWNLPLTYKIPEIIDPLIYYGQLTVDSIVTSSSTTYDCDLMVVDYLLNCWSDIERTFANLNDWYFTPISVINNNTFRQFFLSQGGNNVFMFNKGNWRKIPEEYNVVLPANTLVYAELVTEFTDGNDNIGNFHGFHIIDGLFISGYDMRKMKFQDRINLCEKFAKTINCKTMHIKTDSKRIAKAEKRFKLFQPIRELPSFIEKIRKQWRYCRDDKQKQVVSFLPYSGRYFEVNGILFFNTETSDPTGILAPVLWNWKLESNDKLHFRLNATFDVIQSRQSSVYFAHFQKLLAHKIDEEPTTRSRKF